MKLSNDALIFGLGYLNGPKATLSFGGEDASMRITDRARAALDELIAEGYAVTRPADTQIPDREYYRGTAKEPSLGQIAKDAKFNMLSEDNRWNSFEKIVPENDVSASPTL